MNIKNMKQLDQEDLQKYIEQKIIKQKKCVAVKEIDKTRIKDKNILNEKIEKMQEKILNFQEIINQKDIALNNTHKILVNIYDRYNQLEKEYQTKIEKLKQEIEEKEEDYKYMGDKLIDTFSYLNK